MNRITQKFQDLKKRKKKAFIAFVTAGDPDLKTTKELVFALEKSGADIVELGVPFSDPLADGTTIQASSQRALKKNVSLEQILNLVKDIRRTSQIPLALMTYYNPVFHLGVETFVKKARVVGVDGVIVPDLPPEEAGELIQSARKNDLVTVFFVSPTTRPERMKKVVKSSTGFIYYISLTGVTGARQSLPSTILKQVKQIKKLSILPVCIGFGISTPKQVRDLSRFSDGVIVGSAIVSEIYKNKGKKDLVKNVAQFVKRLSA